MLDEHEPTRFDRRAFLVALFAGGFALRWLFADGDVAGDDAWYLYLSRTFGLEAAAQHEQPWFHVLNRPVFYLFYHLSSYAGLAGFRLAGCVVGAAVPVLAYRAAERLGASPPSAAFAASFLCLQRQQLEYSAYVFPDVLAAAFALAAIQAAGQSRRMLGLSLCCVLSKESFVCVPALALGVDLLARGAAGERFRLGPAQWLTLVLPMSYVAGVTALGLSIPGLQMQGWSTTRLDLRHARTMWIGPELWPFVAWLAFQRQGRILLLWLGLPAFYLVWSRVFGRGIAPWYAVGPCALAAVAVALTLDALRARARARSGALAAALVALLIACSLPVPVSGALRVRAQWAKVQGFPWPRAAPEVQRIIAQFNSPEVLLVDCFWAYRYTHLRGDQPSKITWRLTPDDDAPVFARIQASPLVVFCRQPGHEAMVDRARQLPFEVVFEDRQYLVLRKR